MGVSWNTKGKLLQNTTQTTKKRAIGQLDWKIKKYHRQLKQPKGGPNDPERPPGTFSPKSDLGAGIHKLGGMVWINRLGEGTTPILEKSGVPAGARDSQTTMTSTASVAAPDSRPGEGPKQPRGTSARQLELGPPGDLGQTGWHVTTTKMFETLYEERRKKISSNKK